MKQQIFSVYDSGAMLFLEPFHSHSCETAIRSMREAVNKQGHQFNRFPEDYTLFHLGEFDQESGMISVHATPHNLGVAVTFMARPQLEVSNGK